MRSCWVMLVFLVPWAGKAWAAELVVIASSDPSLRTGVVIDGAASITVAPEATAVLVSADGRTIRLTGPYSGVPDPSPPVDGGDLVDSLSRLVTSERDSPQTLAVFRGGPGAAPLGRPDLWGIHIARAGRYCLRPDRPAMLWWPGARPGAIVVLSPREKPATDVRIRWPQSKKYAAWPETLTLADDATYTARFRSGDPGTVLTTVLMPPLETDAHRAAWMAEHGCDRQALAVVEAMAADEP